MRYKQIKNLIVGGALIGTFFISNALAYDQMHTHPALTDEIVDFYNLNFAEKLSNQDKTWIIRGSVDEDQGMRPMNHFYDPIHNIGMAGFPTSKQWAVSSGAQSNLAMANNSIAQSAGVFKSSDDYSYPRAIEDYVKGDRQRAMIGFGHLLHLLEDAGVPDHTRNDPHPPIGTFGSPYEHEMAKWNPDNFNIALKLKEEKLKPVILLNLDDYFDKIAKYSNENFFSKDTINNSDYLSPNTKMTRQLIFSDSDKEGLFIVGKDKTGKEFPLAFIKLEKKDSQFRVKDTLLVDPQIGTFILDGYWNRLSREVVLSGAGALNLFLAEAEKAKKEYANRLPEESSWFSRILGSIGLTTRRVVSPQGVDNLNIGDTIVKPTPKVTNLLVSPKPLVTKVSDTSVTISSPILSPSKTPTPTPPLYSKTTYINNSGVASPATPPPVSVLPTPTTSSSPSPSPSPSPTPTGLQLFIPNVVINEIAWMGTATSSNDEWLELYNTTNTLVDLTGWTLKSKDETPSINLDPKIIAPFSFYLLERTRDTVVSDVSADQIYTGALGNGGESLELRDSSGNLKDSADFTGGWPAGDNATKSSMERIDPRQSGDNAANWATNDGVIKNSRDAAGNPVIGTPRTKNSTYVSLKPSAITDLTATGLDGDFGKFILTWSAPNDLDTLSTNLIYDLRYATRSFILTDTWDIACKLASVSLPNVVQAGAPASASFNINSYDQRWYFALKTQNAFDSTDISDISNIPENTTKSAISNSWSMLGANQLHTSFFASTGGVVPTASQKATISWEFNAGEGFIISQPAISESDNIYFGIFDGSSGKVISLDKNGVTQWEYPTNVNIGMPAVLADGAIYFGRIGAGGFLPLTALNPDGSKRWDFDEASTVRQVTISSSGNAYFTHPDSSSDKLKILKTDGLIKTTINGPGLRGFSPVVLENGVIIVASYVSGNQFFNAYLADGTPLWQQFYTGANGSLLSNLSHDLQTGKTYSSAGSRLFDISLDGLTLNAHQIAPQSVATTMVAISDDALYAGFDYSVTNPVSGSKLFSLNKSDLSQNWSFSVDSRINQQIAVDKDRNIYFSTENGKLYGLTNTGGLMWVIDANTTTQISPVLAKDALIWGYRNRLIKIGVK